MIHTCVFRIILLQLNWKTTKAISAPPKKNMATALTSRAKPAANPVMAAHFSEPLVIQRVAA